MMPVVQSESTVIQRVMNLVMPLKDPSPSGKAGFALELAKHRSAIDTALNNVGNLHFARFNITGNYLLMISVYDGGAQTYTREVALQLADVFTVIMNHISTWPPDNAQEPYTVANNPDAFIEWVMAHDIPQLPRDAVEVLDMFPPGPDDAGRGMAEMLHARLEALFARSEHVHLSVYRGYPGNTAARIREGLGQGW